MKTTTLNKIKKHRPCKEGWEKLLNHLGKTQADDEPLSFLTILESNGIDDALWCTRAAPEYDNDWLVFAEWCDLPSIYIMPLYTSAMIARYKASDNAYTTAPYMKIIELAAAANAAVKAEQEAKFREIIL